MTEKEWAVKRTDPVLTDHVSRGVGANGSVLVSVGADFIVARDPDNGKVELSVGDPLSRSLILVWFTPAEAKMVAEALCEVARSRWEAPR